MPSVTELTIGSGLLAPHLFDGYADLAVGTPGEDYGGKDAVGAVNVVYGSAGGLSTRDEFWTQDVTNMQNGAEPGDRFGRVLTAGDFMATALLSVPLFLLYEAGIFLSSIFCWRASGRCTLLIKRFLQTTVAYSMIFSNSLILPGKS